MWMPWKNLCAPGPTPAPRPARRVVPRLLPLEDRLAPATFAVTTRFDVVDPTDGKLSLREAVSRANASPGPDTITLPAGVFKTTLSGHESFNAAGDFNITDSVTIRGASAATTVVDGGRLDRVIDIYGLGGPSSIKVTLQGLTVRGGLNDDFLGGAGILVGNADLVVKDCVITDNQTALSGGGISNAYAPGTGDVTLIRTTVSRNTAGHDGGGIFLGQSAVHMTGGGVRRNFSGHSGGGMYAGSANLTNADVSRNVAAHEAGGIYVSTGAALARTTLRGNVASPTEFGGGLVASSANLTGCAVTGNAAGKGAGVAATSVHLTGCRVEGNSGTLAGGGIYALLSAILTNTVVRGNGAGTEGGGIYSPGGVELISSAVNDNVSGTSGGGITAAGAYLTDSTVDGNVTRGFGGGITAQTTKLVNSTVSNNSAVGAGGGLNTDTVDLANSTVSGNTSGGDGGGIFANHGTIRNCTIVENLTSGEGGGISWASTTDPIRVKNSIVALNLAPRSGLHDVDGTFASEGHNLIGDATGGLGFSFTAHADQTGTALDPLDPKIGVLRHNGGRTQTHALLAGSPAIDRGDNTGAPATDQRGVKRLRDGDRNGTDVADIGAFEK